VGPPRFGFTVTKALGGAVIRNRIRRRLKAAVGAVAAHSAKPGADYVLIARAAAEERPFETLKQDLEQAFERVHRPSASSGGGRKPRKKA
jgi:ribonuclease P protein component